MMPNNFLNCFFSLSDKTAVVTGGTGELCGAIAEGMASAGAEVVLVGPSEERVKRRIAKIKAAGGRAYFLPCQLDSKFSLKRLLEQVLEKSGKIDVLVNGAGTSSVTPLPEISEDELEDLCRENLMGMSLVCQVFGEYFINQNSELSTGGSIINVDFLSGLIPLSRAFSNSSTKGAMHKLSKELAIEWAQKNIRVNTLVPGYFPAEQNKKALKPEQLDRIVEHTPMNRLGESHELIGATVLLASPAGSFITGTELIVDGGCAATMI